jgi:hypothetical protein
MERPSAATPADPRVPDLLRAGGLTVPPTGSDATVSGAYNGLLDPEGAETLSGLLADALAEHEHDGVVIWQEPHDVVLGYAVARRLGVSAVRAYDADGLVGFDGPFPAGARMVIVAGSFRAPEVVRALCALVQQQGKTVVAAASLVGPAATVVDELRDQGVAHVTLVARSDDAEGGGDV